MPDKNNKHHQGYIRWRRSKAGINAYRKSLEIVKQLIESGWPKYSMQTIACQVRVRLDIISGPDKSKRRMSNFNNNYVSYVAREIMSEPDIPSDFFETRSKGQQTKQDQEKLL